MTDDTNGETIDPPAPHHWPPAPELSSDFDVLCLGCAAKQAYKHPYFCNECFAAWYDGQLRHVGQFAKPFDGDCDGVEQCFPA